MQNRSAVKSCWVAAIVLLGNYFTVNDILSAQFEEIQATQGMQVLTRGPIHEAFAETVAFNPQPGVIVPKEVPMAIEELPPSHKPEGENIAWIPGYWAWDDERNDFVWVSGIWRALPPGRQWVPGYWNQVGQDFQWTSGYWADATLGEIEYLPPPPESVETGPNVASPSSEQLWIPGCWIWNDDRYVWRPGYWAPAQQNWVWIPDHYRCTPHGYIFVAGYYDYLAERRGIVFAPVYFDTHTYTRSGFSYRPAIAINVGILLSQLFLRPNYQHYYFGDYYGSNYAQAGYYPSFAYNARGYGYDPIYAQQYWQNRHNAAWANNIQSEFQRRVDNVDARPPRTLTDQQQLMKNGSTTSRNLSVATRLEDLVQTRNDSWSFRAVSQQEQQRIVQDRQETQQFGTDRRLFESGESQAPSDVNRPSERFKLKLPQSPLVNKSAPPEKMIPPPQARNRFPAPQASSQSEPRTRAGNDLKRSPNSELRSVPKVDASQPAPRIELKPAPNAVPRPAPNLVPRPAPNLVPRPAPNLVPAPAPKVEMKSGSNTERKRGPKVERNSKSPKSEPKGKDKR